MQPLFLFKQKQEATLIPGFLPRSRHRLAVNRENPIDKES